MSSLIHHKPANHPSSHSLLTPTIFSSFFPPPLIHISPKSLPFLPLFSAHLFTFHVPSFFVLFPLSFFLLLAFLPVLYLLSCHWPNTEGIWFLLQEPFAWWEGEWTHPNNTLVSCFGCIICCTHHTSFSTSDETEPRLRVETPFVLQQKSSLQWKYPAPTHIHSALISIEDNRNVFPVTVNTYIRINILFIPPQCLGLFMEMSTCSFVGLYFDLRPRVVSLCFWSLCRCIKQTLHQWKGEKTIALLHFYHNRKQKLTTSNKDLVSSYGSIKTNSLITSAKDFQ